MSDVIIIGAGVIGTSIGFHLAKLGCRDVVILEKNYIGSGSTDTCTGGIRQQFSSEANIKLSIESVEFFEHFEEKTGHKADFRQCGYLILATSEAELDEFRRNIALQKKLGVQVELLTVNEILELVPSLNTEDVLGATFSPRDGYADPYSVVTGFASAARNMGVKILEYTEVTGININNDKVNGVTTTKGMIESPIVVNAPGAYAGIIGKMAGLDIPVHPSRRHIFITEAVFNQERWQSHFSSAGLPLVIDFHNGFWFRREGQCLIFGMRNPEQPEGFYTSVDWEFFTDSLAPTACYRLPILADTGIMSAQAGLHSDTPDNMAILGGVPNVEGLYLACGFSGHGFMHSPAVGRLMAELITGKLPHLHFEDQFSLGRFKGKIEHRETAFI